MKNQKGQERSNATASIFLLIWKLEGEIKVLMNEMMILKCLGESAFN